MSAPIDPIIAPLFAVEQSAALQAPSGRLTLSGWIAGFPEVPSVRLRLGTTTIFNCRTGIPRPDVAAVHPNLSGTSSSGFTLETYVSPGFHLGTLEYCRPDHGDWIPFHTLSIQAGLSPLEAQLDALPPDEESTSIWALHGWCFHPQCEITEVSVQFGPDHNLLHFGIPRPDVAANYPQFRTALNSGFAGHLPIGPGKSPVIITAKLRNGSILRRTLLHQLEVPNRELERMTRAARNTRASFLALPAEQKPQVSIIIPIFNQLDLTLACLESLVRHAGKISFEVIVIDDHSTEEIAESLSLVRNLRLISNTTNRGFVLNCNHGAVEACGEFLVFLNNDTEVTPGWLEAMLEVFNVKPDAGAVGAKLVYPNGQLQEAGGLIWADGTGWNYGKGEMPDQPEFSYLRRADYATGACVMIRREFFLEIGSFDPRYCPAYYEDADLAFKIRQRGLHVYFQPDALIVHHEGISSGKVTSGGVKRHQLINQEKFREKWAVELAAHGDGPHLAEMARDRFSGARILVIDACALTPDMDAGSVRMFNMLLILAQEGLKVTFAAENLQFHEPFSTQLRRAGVEHLGVPHCGNLERHFEDFGFSYDLILISRKAIATQFLPIARRYAPQAKVIFDTVDLMFLRLSRQSEVEKSADLRVQADASKAEELSLARAADLTYVVSEDEASVLSHDIPVEKLAVVPLINPTRLPVTQFGDRWGILFVGGYQHPPNLDAILFFLNEVLPIVRESIPNLDIHIVGSRTPPELLARAEKHIHVHGFVADMNPLLEAVRLSIAPLRFGAGVKGKINQSMACGVPVVGTSISAEGMHLRSEENFLVADTPAKFARAVVRLHSDALLWKKLSEAGIKHVEHYFSFARVRTQLLDSFAHLGCLARRKPLELPIRPVQEFPLGTIVSCGPDGGSKAYLAGGWDSIGAAHRWSIAKTALLRVRLPEGAGRFRFVAELFPLLLDSRIPLQRVEISLRGSSETASRSFTQGGVTSLEFGFTLDAYHPGIVELEWAFPDAIKPSRFGLSADERFLAIGLISFGLHRDAT